MKPRSASHFAFPLASGITTLLALSSAQAADITWSGASNTWNTNTNWVGSVLPVSNDSLFFGTPGAGGFLLNNNRTSGSFTVASIVFDSTASAYVIGDGTATANAGNTFVLGAPAATAAFTGSVTNGSANVQTINTPFSMTAARVFIGGADIILTGNISGASGGIIKSGSNTLTLSGTNTYTGQTSVNLGVLRLDSANALPGGIGSSGGLSNLNINGGVVGLGAGDFTRALGSGVTQVLFSGNGGWAAYGADRTVNLGGALASITWATATTGLNGKTLILSHPTATHTVDFQNPLDMGNAVRTVQVDNGSAAIDGKLSGNITGIAGGNLSKTGLGTLVLSGTNNYAGTTTVSAGTLLVNGNNSGGGAVTLNSGAALGGNGTVSGAVTVSTGGMINLRDGAVGTLSLTKTGTSLTFSGTAVSQNNLYFDLGNGAGGTDKIVTTGAHAAATANGVLVNLHQLSGGAVDPGTYTLIQGGAASTFTGYTLATTRAGRNLYSALGASGNNLQVTVAAGAAGDVVNNHYWQGSTSVWNTAQWYSNAAGTITATAPGYSSNVRFAASTPSNLTNTLGEDYEINSLTVDAGLAATSISGNMLTIDATADNGNTAGNGITVNNAAGTTIASKVGLANSQTWTVGTGASLTVSGAVSDFGGGYSLTKAGAGTLTLTGANTLEGPLTVSAGTLAIAGAGQLNGGSHGANIANNGTLSFTGSANNTLAGIISGTGSLNKSGAGTLTLNNSGTFTGGATISGGSISIGSANLVNPLGTGTTTVSTGGTYALSATLITAPLVLNGGTVTAGNSFGSNINSPVTLDANSTLSVSGNLTINGNISGTGGLTKTLSAFVPLNGANTYTGPTVIGVNGGGLTIKSSLYGNDTTKWIPANITVNSGGSLVLNVGGAGEFTISQAGLMFAQLGGVVNNNGLRAGSQFGVDLRTAGGSFTISDNLIDSSGPGGGAVGFRIVGNGTVGAATVELSGNNTYSGVTVVDRNGTIKVSSLNSVNGGSPPLTTSSLGRPTTIANGTIQLGSNASFQGGSLTYTGTGETTDRVINLGGANGTTYRFDQSGTGLLKFTSPFTITDNRGTKTIELQGSTTGTGEIAGAIPFGQSTAAPNLVTKNGTGTWVLSAANLYTGATTINGGTLLIKGANNLLGTVAISTGGNFSLADGTARATTGAATGVGLTLATGSTMAFDWNGGSLDSFTTAGTATSTGSVGIIINNTSPSGSGGTLIIAASGSTLSTANYFLANNTSFTAALTKTATTVSIGAQTPATVLTDAYWKRNQVTGALDTMAYSLGTLSNWASDAAGTVAGGVVPGGSGVNVIFGTTGSVPGSPTTGADMNLGSITFNDTAAVTLAGSNAITLNSTSGTAASTTAALAAVTAGSAISVTSFANATNTISAKLVLGENQTWNIASAKTLTVSGVVSGAKNLTKANAGILTLSGANIYVGATTVTGGTLKAGVASVAGVSGAFGNDSAITLNDTAGVTMDITGFNTRIGSLTGGGTTGGNVTLGAATLTVGGNNTSPAAYAGIISGTNGGLAKIGAGTQILSGANSYTGATTISGGNLQLGAGGTTGALTGTASITNNANLTVNRSNAFTQATDLNSKVISGTGSFTQAGGGTTTLSLTNTYTGATKVNAGTLVVNGNISTSNLTTVANTATLSGSGTVGALTVQSGGFHSPGNSPGIQNTGNYSNAGTLNIEIDGVTVGTNYDQVNTTGSVSLSGLLAVTMGYTPAANQLFFILANDLADAITGTFSNAPVDGSTYTLGGQAFQISYFGDSGMSSFTGGNDVVLKAVPEPRAALLGGLGLLALLRRRRH